MTHEQAVEPISGELFRFYVKSRSTANWHLVDIEEYNWNGWCSCIDFEMRDQPFLERGAFPTNSLRCWHIRKARIWLASHTDKKSFRQMRKHAKKITSKTQTTTK